MATDTIYEDTTSDSTLEPGPTDPTLEPGPTDPTPVPGPTDPTPVPGTTDPDPEVLTYTISYEGLELKVEAYLNADGAVEIKITAITGSADVNAFYWSNGDETGDFNIKGAWNMNGTDVAWDDGLALSTAGLGTEDTLNTYITADSEHDSFTFTLEGVTLAELEAYTIGLRATSTSTEEGSIKAVAVADVIDDGDGDNGGGDDGSNEEEPPVDPEEPPVDEEEPPVDPEEPPVDAEEPPVDPEEPPVDAEEPPVDAEEPPVDAEEPPVEPEPEPQPPDSGAGDGVDGEIGAGGDGTTDGATGYTEDSLDQVIAVAAEAEYTDATIESLEVQSTVDSAEATQVETETLLESEQLAAEGTTIVASTDDSFI